MRPGPFYLIALAIINAAADQPYALIIAAFFTSSFLRTTNFSLNKNLIKQAFIPLSHLLSNLFFLHCLRKLKTILKISNSTIFNQDIKFRCSLFQLLAKLLRYLLSLGCQLFGSLLSYNRFHDFVSNGWKNSLWVINTDLVEYFWKLLFIRLVKYSQRDLDSLKIFSLSKSMIDKRSCSDLHHDWCLNQRNSKMKSFSIYFLFDPAKLIEDNTSLSWQNTEQSF